jgi:hypothetical protein
VPVEDFRAARGKAGKVGREGVVNAGTDDGENKTNRREKTKPTRRTPPPLAGEGWGEG